MSQVHPLLIKVIVDKQESDEVRASSFMVLKKSHPSFMTLQVISHSLRTDQSRQIKTLVYSSLINMATTSSHIPEIRDTYVCIRYMPPRYRYAVLHHRSLYSIACCGIIPPARGGAFWNSAIRPSACHMTQLPGL